MAMPPVKLTVAPKLSKAPIAARLLGVVDRDLIPEGHGVARIEFQHNPKVARVVDVDRPAKTDITIIEAKAIPDKDRRRSVDIIERDRRTGTETCARRGLKTRHRNPQAAAGIGDLRPGEVDRGVRQAAEGCDVHRQPVSGVVDIAREGERPTGGVVDPNTACRIKACGRGRDRNIRTKIDSRATAINQNAHIVVGPVLADLAAGDGDSAGVVQQLHAIVRGVAESRVRHGDCAAGVADVQVVIP